MKYSAISIYWQSGLHHDLQRARKPASGCHNNTALVNINPADACDLIWRPSHDACCLLIGQIGKNELGAKRVPDIVEMLGLGLAGLGVDMPDVCCIANAVEAGSKPITRPSLPKAIHKYGVDTLMPLASLEIVEQLRELRNAGDGRMGTLASTLLQGRLVGRGVSAAQAARDLEIHVNVRRKWILEQKETLTPPVRTSHYGNTH